MDDGTITHDQVAYALLRRGILGQALIERGVISFEQLKAALVFQQSKANGIMAARVTRLLSREEIERVHTKRRATGRSFVDVAASEGLLSPAVVRSLSDHLQDDRAGLFDALVQTGALDAATDGEILAFQEAL